MDTADSETVSKVFASRKILLSQLEQRGFDVSEYNDFSINQVGIMMQNGQLDLLLTDDKGKKIFVKYQLTKSLRQNNIVDMVDDFFFVEDILTPADDLLVVSKEDMNDSIKTAVSSTWDAHGVYISIVPLKRLLFNIMEHSLVPFHEVLGTEEAESVRATFNVNSAKQLPEISRYDPVAVAIGLRPGALCKINRSSKTSVSATYYRYCV